MQRYRFTIPIGDWSDDGHGKVRIYMASSVKPIDEVREAFFVAKERYPHLSPDTFCAEYQDSLVPVDVADEIEKLGGPTTEGLERYSYGEGFIGTPEYLAAVVVWFLNIGNRTIDVRLERTEKDEQLHFYGYDHKGRHIESFGYGVID